VIVKDCQRLPKIVKDCQRLSRIAKDCQGLPKIVKDQKYVTEESQVLSTIFNNPAESSTIFHLQFGFGSIYNPRSLAIWHFVGLFDGRLWTKLAFFFFVHNFYERKLVIVKDCQRLPKIARDCQRSEICDGRKPSFVNNLQQSCRIFNNLSFAIWLWLYLQPEIFGNLAFCRSVCFIHEQNWNWIILHNLS